MNLEEIQKESKKLIKEARDLRTLEALRIKYLGRKGSLTAILRSLKDLPIVKRKVMGKKANALRAEIENLLQERLEEFRKEAARISLEKERLDITQPGEKIEVGHLHPLTKIERQIQEIFSGMGFEIVEGPQVETEYYNFDALNIPKNHPARDLWNTFWLKPFTAHRPPTTAKNAVSGRRSAVSHLLLRTHTSSVQIRYMEKHNPPFRVIAPGCCFRYEATDASHSFQFHQVEGLMVQKDVSLANLKGVLEEFMKRFFDKNVKLRWQPSYFPFVEPGLELLVACRVCQGRGCSTCGDRGWLEVIPCGMVHPNVFRAVRYNPLNWQGFAFGMGLDRLAMMKYNIPDIRLFYSSDLRFIKQF